jgi:hypothetical protein
MGISVVYSLLNTLDTTKIKRKESFVEYVLHIDKEDHSFLVQESFAADFEKAFTESDVQSFEKFMDLFGSTIIQK